MSFAWKRVTFSFLVGLFGLGVCACAPNVKTAVGPQGSHIITCGNGMSSCVAKAGKICGDDGYTILEGVNRTKILGGSSSSYQARSEIGQLTVRCGLPEDNEEEESQVVFKLPERTDEPILAEEPTTQPTAVAGAVCTPGATLACVGPGACQGGQMCLDTGRGYGPCDCGDEGLKKPAAERAVPPDAESSSGPSTIPEKKGDSAAPTAPVVPGAAPPPTPLDQQK